MKSAPLVLIALAFAMVASAQDSRYSFKESYKLDEPGQITISSSDGDIEAVAFEGDKTDVFFIVRKNNRVLNISRSDLEKEVNLDIQQSGQSLSIVVKYRNNYSILDWNDKMVVSFRLQVPPRSACNLRTSDGDISISGFRADQQLNTSDGDIKVSDQEGALTAGTSDGDIDVKKVSGRVEVKTSDGDIRLSEIKGDVKGGTSDGNIIVSQLTGATIVKTSDGNINFKDLSGSLSASTSDGSVSGNLLRLTQELSVRTSDGDIRITVPSRLGLDLDIKGESLHVPLNNFSGRSDEKRIQGKSNGGGIPVTMSTSGDVTLVYN
jgi:DUF4097 and DUF4098 domain-containing protein YvlB